MKYSHYRISLDIHSTQSQVSLPVKQGDTNRKVLISLCEGGKPYQIERDCYAVFSARKPDGTLIENYCIIKDNVIEYAITEQTSAVGGMLDCEIKLYGGDSGLITSPRLTIIVDTRVVSDAEVESYSEYSALTNLYTITNSAALKANDAADNADAKAELAISAASNANMAADTADAATLEANAKATLANTAAENANVATSEANKARDDANEAASNANAKAKLADEAATTANAAAEYTAQVAVDAAIATDNAKTAANNANTARDNANAAASKATTAANNADSAASVANKARDNANTAAEKANTAVENLEYETELFTNNVVMPTVEAKIAAETATENANKAAANANMVAEETEAIKNEVETKLKNGDFNGEITFSDANKLFASAVKETASGEAVRLGDISPLEHKIGVKLSGVTLIPLYTNDSLINSVKNEGDLIVSAVEQTGDTYRISFVGEYWVEFTDTLGNGDKVQVGDVVYSDSGSDASGNGWLKQKITDYSTVTLTKYGKNLLDVVNAQMVGNIDVDEKYGAPMFSIERNNSGAVFTALKDGNSGSFRVGYQCFPIESLKGKTITISFDRFSDCDDTNTSACAIISAADDDFGAGYTYKGGNLTNTLKYKELTLKNFANGHFTTTFTVAEDETRKNLFIMFYPGYNAVFAEGNKVEYANVQIEIGDSETEYEPFVSAEHTPNADGTVEGIVGNGECITLMTDTEGVTIEADYNADTKKYIDKKFAELQALVLEV